MLVHQTRDRHGAIKLYNRRMRRRRRRREGGREGGREEDK